MSLQGLTAVVTGAGGGIGREIAVSLAKEGVKVVLFGGNNKEKIAETQAQIQKVGGKSVAVMGNLTDDKTLNECFDKTLEQVGGFDILINNAGVAQNQPMEQTTAQAFDSIMNINARVPYLLSAKSIPVLRKSNRASIINIASVVAHAGYANQSAYTASKHALIGFTKSLATEVYQDGIRVHAISPGGVYTDMVKISRPDLTPDGMIMPQEIADIVMFLLKNRGNAVIDEIIVHRLNKQPFLV